MIEKACRKNLLAVARTYARATGLSLSTVSRRFHGNQAFLSEFKAGACTVTLSKLDEMFIAFAAEWPKGARWPWTEAALVERPRRTIPKIAVGNSAPR